MSQGQNPEKYSHVLNERKKNGLSVKEREKQSSETWENQERERGARRKEEGETFRKEMTHSIHCCKKWRSWEAVKTAGYIGSPES